MPARKILLGVIGRPHGVRGLAHVYSHTADPLDLTAYGELADAHGRRFRLRWHGAGVAEITIRTDGGEQKITDRDAAAKLTRTELFIERDRLPQADAEEFYLADLVGLAAVDKAGTTLGTVQTVHDYGAGASLEIIHDGGALLVPFTRAAVPVVDIAAGHIVIDPPAEARVAEGGVP